MTSIVEGATLRLSGEIDVSSVSEVRSAIAAALEEAPPELDIDMRDVTFVDSTGLHAVLGGWRLGQERGVVVRAVCMPSAVARAVAVCGLAGYGPFPPADDEPPALRRLRLPEHDPWNPHRILGLS